MSDDKNYTDEVLGEEIEDTEEDGIEAAEDTEQQEDSDYLTQEDFERALIRKHAQWERKLARQLGVRRIEEAIPYLKAGQVVSRAAGLPPTEVVNRVGGIVQPNIPAGTGVPQAGANPIDQRLDRIEGMLEEERTAQLLKAQEAEARKEFGALYDKHHDDIEEKAEELGLSLVDAAAVVLRPHLREHIEEQTRTKQQVQRRRKVEGSGEPPGTGKPDYSALLSPAQKETAKKTGVSFEKYYKQLKRLGKIK